MITPTKIWATGKFDPSDEARKWYVSLFTIPQGQYMPGSGAPEVMTKEHTSIIQAGQFGEEIGDLILKQMRIVADGEITGTFEVRVSGMKQIEGPLGLAGGKGHLFKAPLPVARSDTFEVRIYLSLPVQELVHVRVEFDGLKGP